VRRIARWTTLSAPESRAHHITVSASPCPRVSVSGSDAADPAAMDAAVRGQDAVIDHHRRQDTVQEHDPGVEHRENHHRRHAEQRGPPAGRHLDDGEGGAWVRAPPEAACWSGAEGVGVFRIRCDQGFDSWKTPTRGPPGWTPILTGSPPVSRPPPSNRSAATRTRSATASPDTVTVLDALQVVRLGTQVVDEVRRHVRYRGHQDDPIHKIRGLLRHGVVAPHRGAAEQVATTNRCSKCESQRSLARFSRRYLAQPSALSRPFPEGSSPLAGVKSQLCSVWGGSVGSVSTTDDLEVAVARFGIGVPTSATVTVSPSLLMRTQTP